MPDPTRTSGVPLFVLVVTRVVYVGLCVMGVFAIPEARNLLKEGYHLEGSTIYVPLQLCRPSSIVIGDQALTYDYSDGVVECITLNLLVNACACSIVVSIMAAIAYVGVDGYVRFKNTRKHRGMVTGMGIFLCFILMQTAFSTGALSRQSHFYQKLYNDIFDASSYDYKARMHGSLGILWTTTVAAFIACVTAGVESIFKFCWVSDEELGLQANAPVAMNADPSLTPNKQVAFPSNTIAAPDSSQSGGPSWTQV